MLIDTEQVDAGHVVRSDLCIIGAGAAGITIARRLIPKGWRICLLESGGLDFEPDVQNLYAGPAGGTVLPSESAYLSRSRLRFFGGSTNHWTGFCRPLDEIDFTVRPWVPHSGWPFQKSVLDAYYREAARIVQVPHFDQARDEGQQWGPGSVLTESEPFSRNSGTLAPRRASHSATERSLQRRLTRASISTRTSSASMPTRLDPGSRVFASRLCQGNRSKCARATTFWQRAAWKTRGCC